MKRNIFVIPALDLSYFPRLSAGASLKLQGEIAGYLRGPDFPRLSAGASLKPVQLQSPSATIRHISPASARGPH